MAEDLTVNLADPVDIREKLPEAQRLYEAKVQELSDLERDVQHWRQLVEYLSAVAGVGLQLQPAQGRTTGTLEVKSRKRSPAQDAAVEALEAAGRPMGPSALYRFMIGQGMEGPKNPNALGASLFGAARAGRIRHLKDRNEYAPLNWSGALELETSENDTEPQDEATRDRAHAVSGQGPG